MNKYQRAINQIVKDNYKKEEYINFFPQGTVRDKKMLYRRCTKKMSLEEIIEFKNWNKELPI